MNAKVNYSLVGLFVLASIAIMFVFVLWLIKPADEEVMAPYYIYFTESVSGLNIDSPVKFRGVTIGKVKKMRINPINSEEIEVLVMVQEDTPIKTDTVAKLKAQGITGLSYIDLSKGSREAPRLKTSKHVTLLTREYDKIGIIKSVPSFFAQVEKTFGSVSVNLSKTLHRTDQLLGDENQERIARILENLANTLSRIERALDEKTIKNFHRLVASSASTMRQFDETMPRIEGLIENSVRFEDSVRDQLHSIALSYKEVQAAMEVFRKRNENGDYSVKEYVGPPMKQFELTMRELQQTLLSLNDMLVRFSDSPSDILLQSEEPNIGPGEKR
jgi:phospholipid/cholesterol/gamma-HCH transport system substrate-binding protein